MFDRDKWQEIFSTISKNKLRTFLTSLGVFWGIFMLIFLLGMGKGLENGVYKDFDFKATNIMYVNTYKTSIPYNGYKAGRYIRMTTDDLEAVKQNIAEVDKIAPRNDIGARAINYGEKRAEYSVRGEGTELINLESNTLKEGRFINQKDLDESRKVVAIGTTVKEILFGEEEAIGKHVLISGVDFQVIGIYGPLRKKEWTKRDMESVTIPLTTLDKTFGAGNKIDWFICSAKPGTSVSVMEDKVRALIKERHHVAPSDAQAINGFNLEKQYKQITALFLGIKLFLWFVGIGTLIAGIVGVSNIMLIIVKERTKEIGIRKALGATPGSIINMILTESVFITALSGYLGLVFATFIIGGLDKIMEMNDLSPENFYNPEVNLSVGIGAIVTLIIAGVIAGLIPALQAARVNPVIALKDE